MLESGSAALGLGGINNLEKDIGSDNKNNLKALSRISFRKEQSFAWITEW